MIIWNLNLLEYCACYFILIKAPKIDLFQCLHRRPTQIYLIPSFIGPTDQDYLKNQDYSIFLRSLNLQNLQVHFWRSSVTSKNLQYLECLLFEWRTSCQNHPFCSRTWKKGWDHLVSETISKYIVFLEPFWTINLVGSFKLFHANSEAQLRKTLSIKVNHRILYLFLHILTYW